jgi:hypothetical protein
MAKDFERCALVLCLTPTSSNVGRISNRNDGGLGAGDGAGGKSENTDERTTPLF